ncbi:MULTISPECIES: Crp/Fnr family transcriptional regulator [unclassified Chryseobacterium]|uniref:Crp/Fnr family transcriptional regulator n=1 Tax=unclassified Chryseobacterium TaxID=2593645 RepID=UPI00100C3270|nr:MULTISPECIES: Crp/Fnr family transcriptional regulator [unclassified Chryseobacterium]RXM53242.1 Crp/Fnr family transcriptional regulator [Chryseobacterium sp. CH25]RXM65562.1 Crp/Fnr family transcriptional regulator [Chryseobacterium sp. CH1]
MTEHIEKIQSLISRFDKETLKILEEITVTEQLKKGDILLQQGEICRKSSLIVDGVARKFIYTDKKEVTSEFFFKNDIAISFKSYIHQKPSKEVIECLTDVTVETVDYKAFETAKKGFPLLTEYDILLTELYIIWLEDRLFDFHALNATERYEQLLKKSPEYFHHLKLTHIASYLGVSLETLSRIRAKK